MDCVVIAQRTAATLACTDGLEQNLYIVFVTAL
jgi:hypothetical protein